MRITARHSNGSLVMVGTVHGDPNGYSKLKRFLKMENPEYLTVEISPYARDFRKDQGAVLRSVLRSNLRTISIRKKEPVQRIIAHPSILGLFILQKEPYEWRAAWDYARENRKSIEEIDLSAYSREKLAHIAEMTSPENLMSLLELPFEDFLEQVEVQYGRARILFARPPTTRVPVPEIICREISMAEKIGHRVLHGKGMKVVHIGGWEHLVDFPDHNSLWGRLKNFNPRRVLLQ